MSGSFIIDLHFRVVFPAHTARAPRNWHISEGDSGATFQGPIRAEQPQKRGLQRRQAPDRPFYLAGWWSEALGVITWHSLPLLFIYLENLYPQISMPLTLADFKK